MEYVKQDNPLAVQTDSIGSILLQMGKITAEELARIVSLQLTKNLLFGQAAVQLNILTEDDMQWALASQFSYPYLLEGDDMIRKEVIAVHQPFSRQVETFRSIRSELMLSGAGSVIKSLAVLSPNNQEGRSFVASNLAAVFAQLGSKTLLVDMNLRAPQVHELFNVRNNCGMSSLIIKRATLDQAIKLTAISSLHVLPAGPRPPNPAELIGWQVTSDLLAFLKDKYDMLIIDTPAFLKTADALKTASLCDGAVILALKGHTTNEAFGAVKKKLDASGLRVLGALINDTTNMQTTKKKKPVKKKISNKKIK